MLTALAVLRAVLATLLPSSFDNGTSVQSASSTWFNRATDTFALGAPEDPTRAIAAAGGICQLCESPAYTCESKTGHRTFALDLGTGTGLSVSRGVDSTSAVVGYYVVVVSRNENG